MTTPIPSLLPLASTGCGCGTPAKPSGATSTATPDARKALPNSSAIYQVEGMTCGHCTNSVTDEISALPEVDDVHIDVHSGGISTVTVTGDASPEDVRQAIDGAGYTVVSS